MLAAPTLFTHRNASMCDTQRHARMQTDDTRDAAARQARCVEAARIELLLERDGAAATRMWIHRTLVIYRRSVLDRRHFAHTADYRLKFVVSCLVFRQWLAANGGYGNRRERLVP